MVSTFNPYDGEFNNATDSHGFEIINHNETNFDTYKDFQKELDKKFNILEKKRDREERISNLRKWDNQLTSPWNSARLDTISDKNAAYEATKIIKNDFQNDTLHGKPPMTHSFWVTGAKGTGKTFLSLAIIRRYIGMGLLLPSQVKHISEDEFLNIVRAGYKYNDELKKILNHKMFLLDNVGSRKSYTEPEGILWSQFFENVSRNGSSFIFTSNGSSAKFNNMLTESAQSKFLYALGGSSGGRRITMQNSIELEIPDDYNDEEIGNTGIVKQRLDGFDKFSG